MNVVGSRIDGRLVHGQVANLWTPKLKVDRIIVIDNDIVSNDIEKSGLRMATPMTTKLSVSKLPKYFLELINLGVNIKEINVGTMSQTSTTKPVTKQINVEKEDIDTFNKLSSQGIKLIAQLTPSDKAYDFITLLKNAE